MGEPNGHGGLDITPFVALLVIASVVAMLGQRLRIPYALALVITGLLIGTPHLLPQAHLEPHTLFTVFLPPLLFESALNLRLEPLRRNWKGITLFALGGTLISTLVVGMLVHWLLRIPLTVALVFGAIISPTDPISVVALFKRLGVGGRLALLVEAESLFNDGVAVVIFGVLVDLVTRGGGFAAADALMRFFTVVVGGAGVGLGLGLLSSRITRYFDDHLLEIMLTTVVAFGAYLCAEWVHVSGVIAVVTAGLVVGSYGVPTGMSPTTRLAVSSFWEYAAFVANSLVFLLIGLEVTYLNLSAHLGPIALAVAAVLAGRAVSIYALAPVSTAVGTSVPAPYRHILFWGGVRGALSVALALGLSMSFPQRELLVMLTFGVVLFSLLAQGLTVEPLLNWLKLTERNRATEYRRLAGQLLGARAAQAELERLRNRGLVARAICEPLAREGQERIEHLEGEIAQLHVDNEALLEQQTAELRGRLLAAEKSALQEARRYGVLNDDELRHLEEEVDVRLAEVQSRAEHD